MTLLRGMRELFPQTLVKRPFHFSEDECETLSGTESSLFLNPLRKCI